MRSYYTFMTDERVATGVVIREHGRLFIATQDAHELRGRWQAQYTQYTEKLIPPIFENGRTCHVTEVEALPSFPTETVDERLIAYFIKHGASSREEAISTIVALRTPQEEPAPEEAWDAQRWLSTMISRSDYKIQKTVKGCTDGFKRGENSSCVQWRDPFTMGNFLEPV